MEKITQVTEADVGRIAVSEDGYFCVKIITGKGNESTIEFLNPNSAYDLGEVVSGFGLINGARTMYWEDSAEQKSFEANTPFTKWCAENGYDPKGEFVYDKENTSEDHINCGFSLSDVFRLYEDDHTTLPRFINQLDQLGYEDFFAPGSVSLKQKEKQRNVAKPRFRKPRQKPPVREKTDVTLEYVDGKLYHLKNVKLIDVNQTLAKFNFEETISEGIEKTSVIKIDINLIKCINIFKPSGTLEIFVPLMRISAEDFTGIFKSYCKKL